MLWSTSNGDEVQNVYHNLTGMSFLMGAIFCYGWIFFSNNCITPSFLALSEDGYIKQSKTEKFSWLSDNLIDPVDQNLADLIEDELPFENG